jgi:GAF domain-containing protein
LSALSAGWPQLIEHVDDALLEHEACQPATLEVLYRMKARSIIVLPLRAGGRDLGAMSLVTTSASGRRYDADDLAFARVLVDRVALALDRAGMFSELVSLEAQQSAALGSLAEGVTIQNPESEIVYANEAAAHTLGFASAHELMAAPRREVIESFDLYHQDGRPLRGEEFPSHRVLSGEQPEPLLIRAIERATGEERWRLTKSTGILVADGRPRFVVNVIEDVTDVKRAELAQRFLAQVGPMLASSLDYEQTLAQVARLAVPELADLCHVSVPDGRGYLRAVATTHADPSRMRVAQEYVERYPSRVDDERGAGRVLREGVPFVTRNITDERIDRVIADPEQREALRAVGINAVMSVPLVGARGVNGVLSLLSAESRRTFGPWDVELAAELGRRAGIAVENSRLYTERSHIARVLEAGLLPDPLPEIPGFELASLYRPAGEENLVGGDFYDVVPTPGGWMLLMGDVTGRGPEAAALTAQARHTLRTAAALVDDPVGAVRQLNRTLVARRDLSICTVVAMHVAEDGAGARVRIVSAGHPLPVLVRGGVARTVGDNGPLVGAWGDASWSADTVVLEPGDLLVLVTDGVTDAQGEEERFGDERLLAAVAPATDAHRAVAALEGALAAFQAEEQGDDTAVLVIQRQPAS